MAYNLLGNENGALDSAVTRSTSGSHDTIWCRGFFVGSVGNIDRAGSHDRFGCRGFFWDRFVRHRREFGQRP